MVVKRWSALRALMHGMCEDDFSPFLTQPELTQSELVVLDVHALEFGSAAGSSSSGIDQLSLIL